MLELFWNLSQQRQIAELQTEGRNAASETEFLARREASRQVQELSDRLDKIVMVMHAMWTLLSQRTNVTEAELLTRITEIDAQDGAMDGRITRQPVKCSCGATVCMKFHRCLFCGKEYRGSGFETL